MQLGAEFVQFAVLGDQLDAVITDLAQFSQFLVLILLLLTQGIEAGFDLLASVRFVLLFFLQCFEFFDNIVRCISQCCVDGFKCLVLFSDLGFQLLDFFGNCCALCCHLWRNAFLLRNNFCGGGFSLCLCSLAGSQLFLNFENGLTRLFTTGNHAGISFLYFLKGCVERLLQFILIAVRIQIQSFSCCTHHHLLANRKVFPNF